MRLVACAAAVLVLVGCGYRPLGHGDLSALPTSLKTIAIGPLKNRTLRPSIQLALTDALIQRFGTDGRVRMVEAATADAVLEGTIDGFAVDPLAFDPATDTARRARLSITFSFTVRDRIKDAVLLRDAVVAVAYAMAGPGIASTRLGEDEAMRRAIADLAGQVVNRIVEGI